MDVNQPRVSGSCVPNPEPGGFTHEYVRNDEVLRYDEVKGVSVGAFNHCAIIGSNFFRRGGTMVQCWGGMVNGVGGVTDDPCPPQATPEETESVCRHRYLINPGRTTMPGEALAEYLDIGSETACAILESGRVACWGRNDYGQTGSQRALRLGPCLADACEALPFLVPVDMSVIVGLSVGGDHVCAVNQAGLLYCWGRNDRDQTGLPSDAQPCYGEMPCVRRATQVPNLPPIIDVAAGRSHTCVLDHVGGVLCWGDNQKGQLGIGQIGAVQLGGEAKTRLPMVVGRLEPMTNLTAGEFSNCARSASQRVYCWGDNSLGQLGDGNCTPAVPSPMQVDFGF